MKKLLLISAVCMTMGSMHADEYDDAKNDPVPTHQITCSPDGNRIDFSCNAVCKKSDGWSKTAVMSNTSSLKGVKCVCNNGKSVILKADKLCSMWNPLVNWAIADDKSGKIYSYQKNDRKQPCQYNYGQQRTETPDAPMGQDFCDQVKN